MALLDWHQELRLLQREQQETCQEATVNASTSPAETLNLYRMLHGLGRPRRFATDRSKLSGRENGGVNRQAGEARLG